MKKSLEDFGVEKDNSESFLWVGDWVVTPGLILVGFGYALALIAVFGHWLGLW